MSESRNLYILYIFNRVKKKEVIKLVGLMDQHKLGILKSRVNTNSWIIAQRAPLMLHLHFPSGHE